MKNIIIIFILSSLISGCSFSANNYGMSQNNIELIRQYQGNQFSIGEFSDNETSRKGINCRGLAEIILPNNQSYADYIKNAIVSELGVYQILNPKSKVVLNGIIDEIRLDTMVPTGMWTLSVEVVNQEGHSFRVESTYQFSVNYFGEKACQQAAQAFEPAVQGLIYAILSDQEFKQLFIEHNNSMKAER